MKDKVILTDGTVLEIEAGTNLAGVIIVFDTKSDMIATWDKLTNDNLKEVRIVNSDDVLLADYNDLVLSSETSTIEADGTIRTSFSIRAKTELELLREEVKALKETQAVQSTAIEDLGTVTSVLAEDQEVQNTAIDDLGVAVSELAGGI